MTIKNTDALAPWDKYEAMVEYCKGPMQDPAMGFFLQTIRTLIESSKSLYVISWLGKPLLMTAAGFLTLVGVFAAASSPVLTIWVVGISAVLMVLAYFVVPPVLLWVSLGKVSALPWGLTWTEADKKNHPRFFEVVERAEAGGRIERLYVLASYWQSAKSLGMLKAGPEGQDISAFLNFLIKSSYSMWAQFPRIWGLVKKSPTPNHFMMGTYSEFSSANEVSEHWGVALAHYEQAEIASVLSAVSSPEVQKAATHQVSSGIDTASEPDSLVLEEEEPVPVRKVRRL